MPSCLREHYRARQPHPTAATEGLNSRWERRVREGGIGSRNCRGRQGGPGEGSAPLRWCRASARTHYGGSGRRTRTEGADSVGFVYQNLFLCVNLRRSTGCVTILIICDKEQRTTSYAPRCIWSDLVRCWTRSMSQVSREVGSVSGEIWGSMECT